MYLYADSNRGVYIPQYFAESANRDFFTGISDSDWTDLAKGPDFEWYWETWDRVLDNAITVTGEVLHQDGDLWLGSVEELSEAF